MTILFISLEIEICHLNIKYRERFLQLLMKNFSVHAVLSSTSINILCFSLHLLLLCLMRLSVNRGILRKKEGIVEKTDMLKLLFAWVLEF